MSVAIAQVLGPALDGRSKERPELARRPIPLVAAVEVLPCRGGEEFLREVFDPPRLAAFERVVFKFARPTTVVLTTPNREYNVTWPHLAAGAFRHEDHRFEWSRAEFQGWANGVAGRYGYEVAFRSVGPEHADLGSPTQMGVFRRETR